MSFLSVSSRIDRARRSWAAKLLRKPGAVAGAVIVLVAVLTAILAPWIAPHPPTKIYYEAVQAPPSWQHPFGTDQLGRDVLSRVIYGARISMTVGVIVVAIGLSFGTLLGLLAGYYQGWVDQVVMRVMEILLAFPEILLAIAIVAILGPDLNNTMIAVGISVIPVYALTVRSSVLSILEREYIQAARALGASNLWIIFHHVLPNVASPILVVATVNVGVAILVAAGLRYVGLGAQPPTPEWGSMLSQARDYLQTSWWIATFPGLAITLVVLGFNLLGDALRDLIDPRSSK
ncbi:MAG: ABC transporter permease [Meiothermus silvanus]|nr:ABC transporter permease [Allomeiothermus silvanus]